MKEYAGGGGRSKRAKRKTYVDGMLSSDEETENIEEGLDPEELYKKKVYPAYFVKEMKGEDVTVEHFQKTGFKKQAFFQQCVQTLPFLARHPSRPIVKRVDVFLYSLL